MEQNDQQLAREMRDGSERAASLLVRRYVKPIYNFIYRMTGSAADAEDLVQETFFKAWRNNKTYRTGESFKAWLYAIARNTTIDWLRKKKHVVFSDMEDEEGASGFADTLADPAPLPDELVARAQDQAFLERLLAHLSPAAREILLLHARDDLTFAEIGRIVGRPLDTVKSQYRRALLAVRALLDAPK